MNFRLRLAIGGKRLVIATLLVLMFTVLPTIIHGHLLSRWGESELLQERAANIEQLPASLGHWQQIERGPDVAGYVQEMLQVCGYVHRVYQHNESGQKVGLLLLVGPAGPLVRHPPEICYATRANNLQRKSELALEPNDHSFRVLHYRSNDPVDGDFLVAYAFGSDGTWQVPQYPRLRYAGKPMIYKMQVLADKTREDGHTIAGLRDFLQQITRVMQQEGFFSPPGDAS